MKTCLSRVAAVAAIGALTLASQPAIADSGEDNGAIVIKDDHCVAAVPTESGDIISANIFEDTSARTQRVQTPSGNTVLMCHFSAPESLKPSSRRSASGFTCRDRASGQVAYSSELMVAPSGRGLMICRLEL